MCALPGSRLAHDMDVMRGEHYTIMTPDRYAPHPNLCMHPLSSFSSRLDRAKLDITMVKAPEVMLYLLQVRPNLLLDPGPHDALKFSLLLVLQATCPDCRKEP